MPLVRRVIVDRDGVARRIGLTINVSHPRLDDIGQIDDLAAQGGDVASVLSVIGSSYADPRSSASPLLVEAVVAAKRHPEVGKLINSWVLEGEGAMTAAIAHAQATGMLAGGSSAEAVSRFLTIVGLGARLAAAMRLPAVDADEWVRLIDFLVDSARLDDESSVESESPTD